MAKIPGFVYFLVGLIVSGISWYLNFTRETNDLEFFFWAGLVFIVVGVFKIMLKLILGGGKKDRVPDARMDYKHHRVPHKGNFCPACGTAIARFDMYCRGCGRKVK